jgi:CBS-domain-containing membrane protein
VRTRITQLPGKMRGKPRGERKKVTLKYACWSLVSVVASICAIYAIAEMTCRPLLVAPFAASAVLVCGAVDSDFAQPRNLVGGHLLGALVAVITVAVCGSGWYPAIAAVGIVTFLMNVTDTTHPPAGATTFLGVTGNVGPLFILTPILAGTLILLAAALLTNNVVHHRRYPKHWL